MNDAEIIIRIGKMKIDDTRGGQHVGCESGVLVTHEPSGISAYVNMGFSQHISREIALDMIMSALTHPKYRP